MRIPSCTMHIFVSISHLNRIQTNNSKPSPWGPALLSREAFGNSSHPVAAEVLMLVNCKVLVNESMCLPWLFCSDILLSTVTWATEGPAWSAMEFCTQAGFRESLGTLSFLGFCLFVCFLLLLFWLVLSYMF